eukprot:2263476-Alexandrium_andersonii.AAC.1
MPSVPFPESLLVARPVNRAEVLQKPKAQAALKKEWDRLRAINVWDEERPHEWKDVAHESERT